jgi:DNA invertase Pin-like site-specific DNA recombinase
VAGQRIGYVRVSTLDQNEKRHLEGQVLDRIFTDKAWGRDTALPQLTELLRFARGGDGSLCRVRTLPHQGKPGIALAKQRGAYKGRKKTLTPERAAELVQRAGNGVPKVLLARDYGISRETVYQYLRQAKVE